MAVNVRVTGPDLFAEENRRALFRIEESIRQYSAHTRESFYLVRRPLHDAEDHFVLLWSHGIAIVEMVPIRGSITGSLSGSWHAEHVPEEPTLHAPQPRVRRERAAEAFPNSYLILDRLRNELREALMPAPEAEEHTIATVAVFTAAQEVQIENGKDSRFSALTLEDALSRSIIHRPNLLRASETPGIAYSNEELERMAAILNEAAKQAEQNRAPQLAAEAEAAATMPRTLRERPQHSPYWLVLVLLILIAFTYVMIRVILIRSAPPTPAPAPTAVSHAPSQIVIETPIETELFISPMEFQSREALDRALTYGEGLRFLPARKQVIIMDSVTLAAGVYGYFKVEETWRKGMLLQTLSHTDTIQIVKFLDPLP